ncbi:MAG: CdvA-like protein [Candidatus Bathyarchaeia archaeon]
MISWKSSFKRLNEEFEMVKKKKQALDNLLNSGRISQSTYEIFGREITEAIAEIERQQKILLDKMQCKMKELEGYIKTLERLFANFEIQHVAGEVDDELYQREITPVLAGLETSRQELDAVKEAINQLSACIQTPPTDVTAKETQTPEISKTEVEVMEQKTQPMEGAETIREETPHNTEEMLLEKKEQTA